MICVRIPGDVKRTSRRRNGYSPEKTPVSGVLLDPPAELHGAVDLAFAIHGESRNDVQGHFDLAWHVIAGENGDQSAGA